MERSPAHTPAAEAFLSRLLYTSASSAALSPLVPVSPSGHPQSASSWSLVSLQGFQSPALPWHKDPPSPPPASESWTLPQSFNTIGSALAPSSLISTVARRPSGSALVSRRPSFTMGFHSSSFASSLHPSGSVGAPPWSSVAPAPLQCSGFLPSQEPSTPPWPS